MSARRSRTIPSIASPRLPRIVKSSLLYALTSGLLLIIGAAVLVTVLGILALALLIGIACIVGAVYAGVVANQEYKREKTVGSQTSPRDSRLPPSAPPIAK